MSRLKVLTRHLRSTSTRTFLLYPLIVVVWELAWHGVLYVEWWFVPVMLWGYLQYRLIRIYRSRRGGGGPGMDTPPERLVTTGLYAYTRNPMYLGQIIFLIGLSLTLKSWFAAALTVAVAVWFDSRVRRDERQLVKLFGQPYQEYIARVKRWVPGVY